MTAKIKNNIIGGMGAISFICGIAVFLFAEGVRRWYSGIYFILIAVILIRYYLRRKKL